MLFYIDTSSSFKALTLVRQQCRAVGKSENLEGGQTLIQSFLKEKILPLALPKCGETIAPLSPKVPTALVVDEQDGAQSGNEGVQKMNDVYFALEIMAQKTLPSLLYLGQATQYVQQYNKDDLIKARCSPALLCISESLMFSKQICIAQCSLI